MGRGHRKLGEVTENGERSQNMGIGHREWGEFIENGERSEKMGIGHREWGEVTEIGGRSQRMGRARENCKIKFRARNHRHLETTFSLKN